MSGLFLTVSFGFDGEIRVISNGQRSFSAFFSVCGTSTDWAFVVSQRQEDFDLVPSRGISLGLNELGRPGGG